MNVSRFVWKPGDIVPTNAKLAGVFKYSDDQPRDEHGRWTSTGESGDAPPENRWHETPPDPNAPRTLFHGTTAELAARIAEEGIRVDRGHQWGLMTMSGERRRSVYMCSEEEKALDWAMNTTERAYQRTTGAPLEDYDNVKCAVFKVEIPPDEKIKQDELISNDAYRYVGNIPKEWIKGYTVFKRRPDPSLEYGEEYIDQRYEREVHTFKVIGGRIMYVPIVFVEKKTTKGGPGSGSWDGPGQPRFAWQQSGSVGETDLRVNGREAQRAMKRHGLDADSMKGLVSLDDKGVNTKVTVTGYGVDGLVVYTEWSDASGYAGEIEQTFTFNTGDMHIDYFKLDASLRDQNLGKEILSRFESYYADHGIDKMSLDADITTGRYAWAKLGFDYAHEDERASAIERFQKYVDKKIDSGVLKLSVGQARKIKSAIGKLDTAEDIASFAVKGLRMSTSEWGIENKDAPPSMVMDLGKAYMLDKNREGHGPWSAVKVIR